MHIKTIEIKKFERQILDALEPTSHHQFIGNWKPKLAVSKIISTDS